MAAGGSEVTGRLDPRGGVRLYNLMSVFFDNDFAAGSFFSKELMRAYRDLEDNKKGDINGDGLVDIGEYRSTFEKVFDLAKPKVIQLAKDSKLVLSQIPEVSPDIRGQERN